MNDRFESLCARDWRERFFDRGNRDWRDGWLVDGERADIRNTEAGMVFSAGPVAQDHGSHAVLWTRESFAGDIRIDFDFTRLDTICRYVNILYIQATGVGDGPYSEAIGAWRELRQIPYMHTYFNSMHLLHVSYAAFGNDNDKDEDYVRARRYPASSERPFPQTGLEPDDYALTKLFKPGITYHMTFIKTDDDLFLQVSNAEVARLFHWPLGDEAPLAAGPVGIRHMWTRCSRYKDVRICVS